MLQYPPPRLGSFLVTYLRLRRVQAWLLLLTALAVGLAFVPLLNLLSYEFCLVLALAGGVAAAHLGSVAVAALRERDLMLSLGRPLPALLALLGRCVLANLLLLAAPLAVISLNALRVKNCDYLEGLAFFGMMPVLGVALATCVGALWATVAPRPVLGTLLALLTLLASVLWGLWRFYDAPPIFGYDPFVGYFPGTLYDEDVAVRAPFLLYRSYNLVWLAALVLVGAHGFDPTTLRIRLRRLALHRRMTPWTLAAVALGVVFFGLRARLGFAVDAEQIARALGGVRHTTHFTIHLPEEMEPAEVDLLAQDHELRYAQLARLFGAAPDRIVSYIFRSSDEKRRLMGAGNTFVAKPWRREVYLQQQGFPHPVLKHELAHVFAGMFGDRLFGVSLRWRMRPLPHPVFNVGLIEGVAVAADWRPYLDELTGHQMAAALVRLKLAPPLRSVFGYGFLTGAASRTYILAGSFCRHLLERHGAAKLTAVYRSGGDFRAVYGQSLDALLESWSRFIAGVEVPDRALQLARERFRRPSILQRVCGHEVANLIAESEDAGARHEHTRAAELLEKVCRFDPGEPTHLLRLLQATAAAGELERALSIGERLLRHPGLGGPLARETLERIGDLRWLQDRRATAEEAYRRAAEHPATPFDRRVLHLKRWALEQGDEVRGLVRRYLVPPPGTEREAGLDVHLAHRLARAVPKSGVGMFLVGKQLAARQHFREAAWALRRALALGLPDDDFTLDGTLLLGRCLYASRQYMDAESLFEKLLAGRLAPGMRLQARDWLERTRWRTGQMAR